jgi:transcription termination/antitermination protein NusA
VTVLDLGNAEAVLPYAEQVPTERYDHGTRLRAYIVEVRRRSRARRSSAAAATRTS